MPLVNEIIFHVALDEGGVFVATADLETGSIVTEGDTLAELRDQIIDAVEVYFLDRPDDRPSAVRFQFEEVVPLATA